MGEVVKDLIPDLTNFYNQSAAPCVFQGWSTHIREEILRRWRPNSRKSVCPIGSRCHHSQRSVFGTSGYADEAPLSRPSFSARAFRYKSIEPWLKRRTPKSEGQKEYLQSKDDRVKLDGMCARVRIPELALPSQDRSDCRRRPFLG